MSNYLPDSLSVALPEDGTAATGPHYRDQYRALAEALPQIVYSALPDGTSDYLNRRWYAYTGATPGDDIYGTWHRVLHPDDLQRATEAWSRSLKTGEAYDVEYRLRGADGKYRWFLAHGVPERDAEGRITRWFGTATDIDRQKREEEKQRFLARLSEETRAVAGPEQVTWAAIRLLGEHLMASRTTYNEVDEAHDLVTVNRDYCREGENILGAFPLSELGAALLEDLRSGQTAIIADAAIDQRTAAYFETVYRVLNIRSFIAAPLIKDGNLVTILSVNMIGARAWTKDEAELVEEVAERTWLAVENARLYQAAQREVAERQRAEDHSSRLACIVESSYDAIVSKDLDGIITYWNAAAERLYGYSAEEMIGRSKAVVIPADRASELTIILDKVRRGERIPHYDTIRRRKDGTLISVSVSVSPVTDASGKIVGAATSARDITERIRGEQERARLTAELASHQKRLDDLIGSVPGIVWEAWGEPDANEQRIDFVSDYVESMLGYTVQEWLSTPNFWKTIVHEDDRERAANAVAEAWSSGSEHINEFRWIRKDGTPLWCETHSILIKDANGVPLGLRGVTIDVSERKRAEMERLKHLAEVQALYEQLQRAMRETHHRVRNSLQIIAALVDVQAPEAGALAAAEEFHRIAGHVRALAAVHDLLTEQAKRDSTAADVSARDVLLTLIDLVRHTAGESRIVADIEEVRLSAPRGTSLAVVAHELITNALTYGQGIIEVRFLVQDGTAILQVSDDGPGFKECFDPEAAGNTGLELVSQVARWDLRADALQFETRPEGGGRVTVTIPLPPEELDRAEIPGSAQ